MNRNKNISFTYSPKRWPLLVQYIIDEGACTSPRGEAVYELLNATLVLKDVRDRVIQIKERKMNLGFALAEWVCLMTGEDFNEFFDVHVKDFSKRFSIDGVKVDGAYGPRVASQVSWIVDLLTKDKDSRQAVLTINHSRKDLWNAVTGEYRSIPCTLSIQFLVREGKLVTVVSMRSSDAFLGLTFDIFQFSMLAEYLATALSVECGELYFNAASLHVYERDAQRLKAIARSANNVPHRPMAPMPRLSTYELFALKDLMYSLERQEFWGLKRHADLGVYTTNLLAAARAIVMRDDKEAANEALSKCHDLSLSRVARYWLERAGTLHIV